MSEPLICGCSFCLPDPIRINFATLLWLCIRHAVSATFQEIGRLDTEAEAPAEVQHTPAPSEPLLFPAAAEEPQEDEVQQ